MTAWVSETHRKVGFFFLSESHLNHQKHDILESVVSLALPHATLKNVSTHCRILPSRLADLRPPRSRRRLWCAQGSPSKSASMAMAGYGSGDLWDHFTPKVHKANPKINSRYCDRCAPQGWNRLDSLPLTRYGYLYTYIY